MRHYLKFPFIKIVVLFLAILQNTSKDAFSKAKCAIDINDLTCERLINPLGIDISDPKLSWKMISTKRGQIQSAYQVIVSSSLIDLDKNIGNLWNSQKVVSNENLNIKYLGNPLTSGSFYYWKVRIWDNEDNPSEWSNSSFWSMGLLNKSDWKGTWIGLDKPKIMGNINPESRRLPARMLRKEFTINKPIKRATAYICGLGLFELSINGNKIGDQVLAPALSDYRKRAYYMTFDITKNVSDGKNAIGVLLGNGRFYAPRHTIPATPQVMENYGFPKLLAQFEIEFADGSKEIFLSDKSWKISSNGPIIANNEFDGEEYDARKELSGWDKPNFNDSAWLDVDTVAPGSEQLKAQMIEPIKIKEILSPKTVNEVSPGVYIFDMGQNMVGWASLKVKGPRGSIVSMRFAETLKKDGNLYTENLRDAIVTDKYILKGEKEELFEPRFTYHGFRYVELTGFPGIPDLSTIVGKVIYDDMQTTGGFATSNSMINAIYKNAYWGIRGNYRSIPTDCPQRDERMGWLGDRATGSKGESFIFNNHNLYAKWLQDIEDSQRSDGSIPDIAPAYWASYSDNVTWPAAYMFVTDMLYEQFGDTKPIEKHYESFKKWIDYLQINYLKEGILIKDTYGDWCVPPESLDLIHSSDPTRKTSAEVLSTTYYYKTLTLLQKFAGILHKDGDLKKYTDLSEYIKAQYNLKYFNSEKSFYGNNTATANLLSLSLGLAPESAHLAIFKNIESKIESDFDGHICTGLVGAQYIMRTLTQFGRGDLAYRLTTISDYPSWGYMVDQGATTIWELWNGNTADPAMNSGNHVMLLGDLIIWYYENLAGIRSSTDAPGFRHFSIDPLMVGDLSFVKASFNSPYGLISSNWEKSDHDLTMNVEVPVNTIATIVIPTNNTSAIFEGNKKIINRKEFTILKSENDRTYIQVGSGKYLFKINL